MSARIDLKLPLKTYNTGGVLGDATSSRAVVYPGTTIHGNATYCAFSASQRTIKSVCLTFSGTLRTVSSPRSTKSSRHTVRLFQQTIQLFAGPHTIAAGTRLVWPWTFDVPTHTEQTIRTTCSDGSGRGTQFLSRDVSFELPPSLDQMTVGNTVIVIRYSLTLRVEYLGIISRCVTAELALSVRDTSQLVASICGSEEKLNSVPIVPTVIWQSERLGSGDKKRNMVKKCLSLFPKTSRSSAPTLKFSGSLRLPTALDVRQAFDLDFSVVYDRVNEQRPIDERLDVKSVKLSLRAYTEIAAVANECSLVASKSIQEKVVTSFKFTFDGRGMRVPHDGRPIVIAKGLRISSWGGYDQDYAYQFKTPMLRAGFYLVVEILVQHFMTKKTFHLHAQIPVRLFDSHQERSEEELLVTESLRFLDDLGLPAYTIDDHASRKATTSW